MGKRKNKSISDCVDIFWNGDKTVCTCVISPEDEKEFIGVARCHPEDIEYNRPYIGENIAYNRALIKVFRHFRKSQIERPLKILTDLYNNMATSHRFNEKSFEAIQMRKEIKALQEAIDIVNENIKILRTDIIVYSNATQSLKQACKGESEKTDN